MRHVVLNKEQMIWGREVGIARFETARGAPRFGYSTTQMSGRATHIVGAQAELAFCTSLSLPWPARVGTYREEPDVDPNWEVRWTSGRRAKIATDDDASIITVHLTGTPPAFDIWGLIIAGWVQRNYPAIDPGNRGWKAHFVPFSLLTPINDDFHTTCGWIQMDPGEWFCAWCGKAYEGSA